MTVEHWGLLRFNEAWDKQREVSERVWKGASDTLVLCEHPDVITLGRTTKEGAVLASMLELNTQGVDVVAIDRGGEATIHNPGQLVGYPIFNLQRSKPDLHWFLRTIEQCIIDAIAAFDIVGHRVDGRTGVWVDNRSKICSIGIHCKRWITTHGFALNVNNNLELFQSIVPCGITDKGVTSISQEFGRDVDIEIVSKKVEEAFLERFQISFEV